MTEIGFTIKRILTKNKMAEVLDKFKFQTEDDLFAAVGYGEVSAQVVCNRLTEKNAANKSWNANVKKQKSC